MSRHERPKAGEDGWTDWQQPNMKLYKMGCCDCGLVHKMQFRVMLVTKRRKGGYVEGAKIPDSAVRVQFKAARDERSTAAVRRHLKK